MRDVISINLVFEEVNILTSETPAGKVKERKDWDYLTFPEATVNANLPEVVQTIEQAVQRLGGLAA